MALDPRTQVVTPAGTRAGEIDEGLRTYMLRVYNYMAGGLAVTGIVAYVTATTPAILSFVFSNAIVYYTVLLAPLGIIFFGFRAVKTAGGAQMLYWLFSALFGLSLAPIFLVYTGTSIARVFLITTSMFAAMSLYGYVTKRDLTGIGNFLIMGLIGLIVAMIVNWFLQSAALDWALSVVGVLIFTGLTAYDTQAIRRSYDETASSDIMTKSAVFGAVRLYLDFLNLFLFLLHLFGNRN
jgi:FtsH-binding integral membrane protein